MWSTGKSGRRRRVPGHVRVHAAEQRTANSEQRTHHGFTLLEVVAVLVLLAVAASLVLPSFTRGMRGLELEAAARDLVTRMKQARNRAITRQKVFRIIVDQEVEENAFYELADEFRQPIKSYPLPADTRVEIADGELPIVVSFYADGRSSGGRFDLRIVEGRRLTISIDPVTGFGRVERPGERR